MPANVSLREHVEVATRRILQALRRAGADALIATSPANICYLTGFRSWTHSLHITHQTYLVLTADGKRSLLLPSSDADFVSMDGFLADEVRTFGTFYVEPANGSVIHTAEERHLASFGDEIVNSRDSLQELKLTLEKKGLAKASLAIDQGHVMPSHWMAIREALPEAKLQDAYGLMLQARSVKTAYEVEMLRRSSECTEKAIQASLAVAAAGGATDDDIRCIFEKSLIDSGAEHLFSAIGVGTRTCFPNVIPNGTRSQKGDVLRYDVGCRYQGYASDLARIATFGPSNPKIRRYYEALLKGEAAAIELMRPGVLAGDVFEVAVEVVRKEGVPHYRRQHCGHAIGLDVYEVPVVRPNDRTRLEAGMTFCIETPYYELGLGGLQVEDLVLVTEDGAEILTALSRELFELAS
jgi:Xaa-Pro dipeptidase